MNETGPLGPQGRSPQLAGGGGLILVRAVIIFIFSPDVFGSDFSDVFGPFSSPVER